MHDFCEEINAFIDDYYEANKNSGVIRITVKDEIIYEKFVGYADVEKKIEFSKDSIFTLYSLSKPFCAIGLLRLKDKNLVDIDKHPGVYLPEAAWLDENLKIRHLLNHTSGIPDFDQNTDFSQKYKGETSAQLREQLERLSKFDMLFKPGTKAKYTNINFIICAMIIENVSGVQYADYMKKEVFEPLGMHNTYVDSKNLILEKRVKGYCKKEEKIVPVERVTERIMGAADIVSTVDDVYCIHKATKHKLLLSTETWNEILTPSPINSMGFGCTISDWHTMKRITHNGGWDGFRTLHVHVPENDFDVIFLSNAGWGNARKDITEAIYEMYYKKDDVVSDGVQMDVGYIN